MVVLVLLPVSVIVVSWADPQTELWQHLIETQLARLLGNTIILVLGVGFWTLLLGVSLAWLTAVCEFPGRRWLDWALMLPLAIPTYVVAFVWTMRAQYKVCGATSSVPILLFCRYAVPWA